MEIDLNSLGHKVKTKRGSCGIRETAKAIGISPATLSRIENGKLPDLKNFALICKWLIVSTDEVLYGKKVSIPKAKLTKEDYAFMYECIERTVQLAKLKNKNG
jgi:transcriptional regulator with XRE-family HTH domain